MTRVGIFTNNYLPRSSGITISIENFRKELTRLGHQVFVFAPNYRGMTDISKEEAEGVFRFPSLGLGKGMFDYSVALPFTPKIDRIIKKLDLDLIHSQHPFWIGQTGMWYAKKLKIPLVFTYHTLYEEYSHYVPLAPQKFLKWYLKKSSLEYVLKSDLVIAPSESVKTMLEKRIQKYLFSLYANLKETESNLSIKVIPSGIDVGKFENGDRKGVRANYKLKPGDILLLCVCRLGQEKNLDFLIKSLGPLLKKRRNTKLLIVGDGPYRSRLEELTRILGLNDKIIFSGFVENSRIVDYYKAADVFVYASVTETQGLILAEALLSGLPVVAVDASGSRDVVKDGENGFLVAESENDFMEKTEKILDNQKLREKLKKQAAKSAESYSLENCTRKLISAYEEAVKTKKQEEVLV